MSNVNHIRKVISIFLLQSVPIVEVKTIGMATSTMKNLSIMIPMVHFLVTTEPKLRIFLSEKSYSNLIKKNKNVTVANAESGHG